MWAAILVAFFLFMAGGAWGFSILQFHVFPYNTLQEISNFVRGELGDTRPFWTRLVSGFVHQPDTFAASSDTVLVEGAQLEAVAVSPAAESPLPIADEMRYYDDTSAKRYFVVYGSFVFPGVETNWGAIVLDSDGIVHRGWPMTTDEYEYLGGHMALVVTETGTIATNTNGILRAYDWCGEQLWQAPWTPHPDGRRRHHDSLEGYDWHHDISYADGLIHALNGPRLTSVDALTGEIVRTIDAVDLIRWGWKSGVRLFDTPSTRLFNPETLDEETIVDRFLWDPFHFNKVDVLSRELAGEYEEFRPGDMLVSVRNLNLVVVIRPSEKRFVWWRYGLVSRQHDATFVGGEIEAISNNPFSVPPDPEIVRFDLDEPEVETLFDLSRWELDLRIRGNFERDGDRLLTIDHDAGRVIAGRLDGTIDFVFENGFAPEDGEPVNLNVHNATEIGPQAFARFEATCR